MPTMYIYPDGTDSSIRPSHDQIFVLYDPQQQPKSIWRWDDIKGQWILQPHISLTGTSLPVPQKSVTAKCIKIISNGKEFSEVNVRYIDIKKEPKCQCGAESCGSNKHSNWCDLFTP